MPGRTGRTARLHHTTTSRKFCGIGSERSIQQRPFSIAPPAQIVIANMHSVCYTADTTERDRETDTRPRICPRPGQLCFLRPETSKPAHHIASSALLRKITACSTPDKRLHQRPSSAAIVSTRRAARSSCMTSAAMRERCSAVPASSGNAAMMSRHAPRIAASSRAAAAA